MRDTHDILEPAILRVVFVALVPTMAQDGFNLVFFLELDTVIASIACLG